MKHLFFSIFLATSIVHAEVPISNLPAFTGASVGSLDTVPFVNFATNTTGQLPFAQFYLIPSLQSPNFLGGLTTPTGTFSNIITSPTGSFTYLYMVGTPTSSYTNCGTIAGAKGCVPVQVDGHLQQVPYF